MRWFGMIVAYLLGFDLVVSGNQGFMLLLRSLSQSRVEECTDIEGFSNIVCSNGRRSWQSCL